MRHTFAFVDLHNHSPRPYDTVYVEGRPDRLGVVVAADGKIGGGTVWIRFHNIPYDTVLAFRFTQVHCVSWVKKIEGELI